MRKLAIFDFCMTLVNFETADAFVDYVRKSDGRLFMKFLETVGLILRKTKITAILNKIFPYGSVEKRIKLIQLLGLKHEYLNSIAAKYYINRIKPNFILPVVVKMQQLAALDYEVCIASAGYSIYLKYFAEDYNIKHIISTEIKFNNHGTKCKGVINGKDCIGYRKVQGILKYFRNQNINLQNSVSFSDSYNDLPMLKLTGSGVVVSKHNSQCWSYSNKLKEIVWDQYQ
jgi:HAD superfamily hydrolase (TIGR01490 family)